MNDFSCVAQRIAQGHIVLNYELKEGTKASYYCQDDSSILPNRISFYRTNDLDMPTATYQLKGEYKKAEIGRYKTMNGGKVNTRITEIETTSNLVGWGEVDRRFSMHDLVVLQFGNVNGTRLKIHIFKDMGFPEYFSHILEFMEHH